MSPEEDRGAPQEETPRTDARELLLLTPFRLPTQNALYLGNDDVSCFLNGYLALWHPAVLLLAGSLPRVVSPYDYEQPDGRHVYAAPESPPLLLPDDWDERVKTAGAVAYRAVTDRPATFANFKDALRARLQPADGVEPSPDVVKSLALLDQPPERVAPFLGIGFGFVHLEALFEAMSHDNLLSHADILADVQAAARALLDDPEPEGYRKHLQSAADRLMAGREVLYSVTIHVVDLVLLHRQNLDQPLPAAFSRGLSCNLLAPAAVLEEWAAKHADEAGRLRERVTEGTVEVCGGGYVEREDALLPLESQLWNLRHGQEVYAKVTGQPIRVYARQRFAAGPQTPSLIQAAGMNRAVLLAFDEAVLPSHRATVVNWPAPDGKQVDAFCRTPHAADNPQTFFHVAHYLHESIMQDMAATLALVHSKVPCPWYEDWVELSRFGPVLGTWETLTRYFEEVSAGDYATPGQADEFHGDYLAERTTDPNAEPDPYGYSHSTKIRTYTPDAEARRHPLSAFPSHARARRKLDAAWTLAAVHRSLGGKSESADLEKQLGELETRLESQAPSSSPPTELDGALRQSADLLAGRLMAQAEKEQPGFLVLNPCSFTRRVVLDLEGVGGPVPVGGPVKTCQVEGGVTRAVVEVPALGFAWFPRGPGSPPPSPKMRLADDRCVRNEFFEAEVDKNTGCLRRILDHRYRISRLGQQLVYNPGSKLKVKSIETTSTGPAYGEIVSEGVLLDDDDKVLATFRQRFRAWVGRPVLDLRIELTPEHKPVGYPWHAYYGSRFAWGDERALLIRAIGGKGYVSSQTRPETPDYLEVRFGKQNVVLLTGGLPFHQRHGGRMLDVILMPEGEEARVFDLAIGLDRDNPMLTAFGMVSPTPVVATTKGPPHVGATGWLFHLDAPNILLTSLRPAPGGADGVVARLAEVGGFSGHAELRCVRDPARVESVNELGEMQTSASYHGDTIYLDLNESELLQLRIDFSVPEAPPDVAPGAEPEWQE